MSEEIFPIVDEEGTTIGQAPRSVCHDGSKLLHPVIHLHVFNSNGELFLQKRAATKDVQPNKWDGAVTGHIDLGESPEDAVIREAKEELNISEFKTNFITKYIIETDSERELSYCFYTVYDGLFEINEAEISDGRFWALNEIESMLGKDVFTINFELDFRRFFETGLYGLK